MNHLIRLLFLLTGFCSLGQTHNDRYLMTAEKIIGNPDYQAICYGGYRTNTREVEPSIDEIKDDLKILAALRIKIIRTYNVHHQEVVHLLEAIRQLSKEDPHFEMYVMLGAWIDCKNAWTDMAPIHDQESDRNAVEIAEAVRLANVYPEIIKIIAVGNEAMVKWATSYYVEPYIILKWVNHLQQLKKEHKLPAELWVTSSDNFASWGGGDVLYHTDTLTQIIKAVDYISMHTYPMHDTHYHPVFWHAHENEESLSQKEQVDAAMIRARDYAIQQYNQVVRYMTSLGVHKPVHIGETGWATQDHHLYGDNGSKATDEYKSALFYQLMRNWTDKKNISCFYFEAFDENWKDAANPKGSENHFGLINLQSEAKYALWSQVDAGVFDSLTRNGKPITKTYKGNAKALWNEVKSLSGQFIHD